MQKIVGLTFLFSWITAGGSIVTIFDGGLPVFLISMAVLVVTAIILTRNDEK